MYTGLILEGGARRGIFSAGVLDHLAKRGMRFDYVCGVSAGAQAAMDFVSMQPGRSRELMMMRTTTEEFTEAIDKLSYKLSRLVYEYSFNRLPFDFDTFFSSDTVCEMTATDCETGRAVYFSEDKDKKRLLDKLCASCSVPVICPTVSIDGKEYIDGSISDAIPFKRAFERGCDRVLVVLTKSPDETATDYSRFKRILSKKYERAYPVLFERLMDRHERYMKQRAELAEYADGKRLIVFQPPAKYVTPFEMSRINLDYAYKCGYEYCQRRFLELNSFMNGGEV